MAKLNQILAIDKGVKSRTHSKLSEIYKTIQKPDLFNGFTKKYEPKNAEGETFPDDNKKVQFDANNLVQQALSQIGDEMDVESRKDYTNTQAKADVVVDGVVLIKDAPVQYLLFLEKKLTDLHTFFSNLPILDENEDWKLDAATGRYKSSAVLTHRTKKVQKPLVLYPATPEHPAQTQLITEDEIVGFWNQTKISSAMTRKDRQSLVDRTVKLSDAVKQARELANQQDEVVTATKAGTVINWLLGTSSAPSADPGTGTGS